MDKKNEVAERLYDEAQVFEGSRPSGLLIQGADEIYRLQQNMEAVLEAATSLVSKLRDIHKLPEYRAVWESAQAHRGPYTGPKYDKELETLETAITPLTHYGRGKESN